MVVFGGGNEGIVDELHVFNTGKSNLVKLVIANNGKLLYFCICASMSSRWQIGKA